MATTIPVPGLMGGGVGVTDAAGLLPHHTGHLHTTHKAGHHPNLHEKKPGNILDARNGEGTPLNAPHHQPEQIRSAPAINEAPKASLTDKGFGIASFILEIPNQIATFVVLPLLVGGWAIKGIGNQLDKWRKVDPKTPGWLSRAGHSIRGPVRFANQSFEDAGKRTGAPGRLVGRIAQKTANIAGAPIDWFTSAIGMNTRRATYHAAQAGEHLTVVKSILDKSENVKKITEAMKEVKELNDFVYLPEAIKNAKGAAEIAQLAPQVEAMTKATKKLNWRLVPEGVHELGVSAEHTIFHHNRAQDWGLGKAIRNAPATIKKAPVAITAWNTGFVGMSAIGMFGTARTFSANLDSLKQMYADMTGTRVERVSTWKVLTGRVPEPVREARSQLLKSMGIQGVVQTVGMMFSLKQLIGGNFSKKAGALQMGMAMGTGPLMALMGDSMLPFYGSLSEAHKRGEQIPPQAYAQFIARINPRFGKIGAEHAVTMAVATKLVQEHRSPGDVMKLQASGQLETLGNAAVMEMKKAEAAHVPETHAAPHVEHSHVNALNGNGHKNMPMPVGEHTKTLHRKAQDQAATPAILGPGAA